MTDNLTGLIWTREAGCEQVPFDHNFDAALEIANELADGQCGLADGSVPGDWRMPNLRELSSLLDYGENSPALPEGHPFVKVIDSAFRPYWTSSAIPLPSGEAWQILMRDGHRLKADTHPYYGIGPIWPVRGGE